MQPVPLITLRHVQVRFGDYLALTVEQWELRPGESWAVLGGNGSGKSTFLRLVRGDVWPAPDRRGRRVYHLNGQPQENPVDLKPYLALVSPEQQERYLRTDWRLTGEAVVQTGFHHTDYLYTAITPAQRERARALMRDLGIEHLRRRDVQRMSQGELRRVLLARALVSAPRLLLLDEFCDGLDASARGQLLALVQHVADAGTPLIYTTHRPDELVPAITHELRLEAGRVEWSGPRANDKVAVTPQSRPRIFTNPTAARAHAGLARAGAEPFLIRLHRCNVSLDGFRALRRVSWTIKPGEHWVITGRNGAGKSTLLKLIAGDVHPALGGRVERAGRPRTLWEIRRDLGSVSSALQTDYHGEALERLTGADAIASGFFGSLGLTDRLTAPQRARVGELLRQFALELLAPRPFLALSYGQRRRFLLARALVHRPALLLLDEPFDGLDPASKTALLDHLNDLAASGTGLLLVTHHLEDLPRCVTQGLRLEGGRIAYAGPLAGLPTA